jgi:hypothetical protein
MGERILEITADQLRSPRFEQEVLPNLARTFYWTLEWRPELYVALASAGFISTGYVEDGMDILLPELQQAYAVLDWQRRRRLPALRRLLRRGQLADGGYTLKVSGDPGAVADVMGGIQRAYGVSCWLCHSYRYLMLLLADIGVMSSGAGGEFQLVATVLCHGDGTMLGGELGYTIGAVYTSLTGFLDRRDPRHRNLGKVQLAALGALLERRGYAFWNLGHPHMPYKIEMGAAILPRAAFLERWRAGLTAKPALTLAGAPSCHPVADLVAPWCQK